MPTYDYECDTCGHSFEQFRTVDRRHDASCPCCGEPGRLVISFGKVQISQFKPFVEHNLDHDPVEIRTARQLDREMKKRNLFKVPVKREI